MHLRLARQPHDPKIPLRFELTQVVDFLPGTDKDHPRREPVDPPLSIAMKKTVDMRDMHGRAGVHARTDLTLTRDRGFRAGVWILTVQGPQGPIGNPVRLTLVGVNQRAPNVPPSNRPDAGASADADSHADRDAGAGTKAGGADAA